MFRLSLGPPALASRTRRRKDRAALSSSRADVRVLRPEDDESSFSFIGHVRGGGGHGMDAGELATVLLLVTETSSNLLVDDVVLQHRARSAARRVTDGWREYQ